MTNTKATTEPKEIKRPFPVVTNSPEWKERVAYDAAWSKWRAENRNGDNDGIPPWM